tara:strand:- start:681 stop:1343 length:663 start_codon:yes stop_codon:yes gene_type:complete
MILELKKRIITSIFLVSLIMLMYFYSFIMVISLIIIAMIVWVEFYALISKIIVGDFIKKKFLRLLYKSISLLYITLLVYLILSIESYYSNLKTYLMYSVIITILSDVGGLTFGKFFKGRKLTKISPNKTISGSLGSFIFSLFLFPIFYSELIKYDLMFVILVILGVSLTAQLGDLFISYLKRRARVKDTSDILPGHGGFLDRVDGLIFAIPMGILLFSII